MGSRALDGAAREVDHRRGRRDRRVPAGPWNWIKHRACSWVTPGSRLGGREEMGGGEWSWVTDCQSSASQEGRDPCPVRSPAVARTLLGNQSSWISFHLGR